MENVVIIGGGPAGVSASLYTARANLKPILIENGPGGLAKAEKIENYYGLETPLTGKDLYERGLNQARTLDVRVMHTQVLGISGFDTFTVQTTDGDIETKSVILTTGSKHAVPKIPGLKELEGRGVSYCAICDAFFYRGKEVAVLGNREFALHEAVVLKNTAAKVTIFTDGQKPEFTIDPSIEVNTSKILSIEGTDGVTGLTLQSENGTAKDPLFCHVDGVFVALGNAGSSEIARQMGAELTDKGNIRVNEKMETTIPGLYAAGDCTGGLLQVSKAVYEGAQAGLSAGQYVRKRGE